MFKVMSSAGTLPVLISHSMIPPITLLLYVKSWTWLRQDRESNYAGFDKEQPQPGHCPSVILETQRFDENAYHPLKRTRLCSEEYNHDRLRFITFT